MRRVVLLLIVLVALGQLVAGEDVTYGSLKFKAISNEKELNSLISAHEGEYFFIFYHSKSCPACNYMKKSVFPTQKAIKSLNGINLISIDVYKGRTLTTLQYKVYDRVLVLQPDNSGYYTPKEKGETIGVGVPGTPTMVIFKVENGEKILKGLAIGALNPDSLEFFVKNSIEDPLRNETPTEEKEHPPSKLSLAVLLPIFSAGILSVFSPCVLPLIAGTFSLLFAKRKIEIVIAGMVVSFAVLGALAGTLGSYVSQIRNALYFIGGLGFIVVGTSLISTTFNQKVMRTLSLSPSKLSSSSGYISDVLLGSALGTTWIGCIAPYLGFAIITATLSGSVVKGVIVMGVYGVGMGLTIYLIMGSKDLAEWINEKFLSNKLSLDIQQKARWEKAIGIVIIILGILMLTELTPLRLWSAIFESLSKI
ncbi:cytochrome c biogenesis protein [Thermococcus argininiproducens]|uniref:Cytochrome c biogenesis protein n=1 Tax=Thermococcus argininiproducens TaxID=2866384 RepID=A0A9E7SCW1_9EURY|nr:cytochrome c biogenesis protein CcdA [Thermococcus argininiproducens]USH00175.1 cytochrome c biogenesis protein [Thermococcus argininiproducens]